MAGKRVTTLEYDQRIFTIQGWILDGVQDALIKRQAKAQWDLSFKQIDRYIKEAHTLWKQSVEITIEDNRASMIAKLQHRARSMDEKFKKTPLGIRALNDIDKMIIRLQALEPPRRIQLQGDPDNPLELNQIVQFQLPNNHREIK